MFEIKENSQDVQVGLFQDCPYCSGAQKGQKKSFLYKLTPEINFFTLISVQSLFFI